MFIQDPPSQLSNRFIKELLWNSYQAFCDGGGSIVWAMYPKQFIYTHGFNSNENRWVKWYK